MSYDRNPDLWIYRCFVRGAGSVLAGMNFRFNCFNKVLPPKGGGYGRRKLREVGVIVRNSQAPLQDASLLWTLEEIARLISESGNPSETLTNIVQLIHRRFETDVCSVYLLEPDRMTLLVREA